MLIKELIERECCEDQDLLRYQGMLRHDGRFPPVAFCRHCGELWVSVPPTYAQERRWVRFFERYPQTVED